MDDLIGRQAAIDEVVAWLKDRMSDEKNGKPLTERLKDLPAAQPEVIRCKECSHGKYDIFDRCLWCDLHPQTYVTENEFCSKAERRSDG